MQDRIDTSGVYEIVNTVTGILTQTTEDLEWLLVP